MTLEMVVIRVVTTCATEDDLVAAFARLTTDSSLFVPTKAMRTPGVETGFSIRLADGTPKLRGLCVVEASYPDAGNAFQRSGVLLGIRKLTPDSESVFARLRDPMLPLIVTDTVQQSPEEARPTVEMAPLFKEIVDCEVTDEPTEGVPTLQEETMRVAADADRTIRVDSARETILGMPPLVPPRKDTEKMKPVERAALLAPARPTASRAPLAIVDEDAGRIALPWRPRLRAWMTWLWRRLTAPAARRVPQAR